jgi:hypothetical protein
MEWKKGLVVFVLLFSAVHGYDCSTGDCFPCGAPLADFVFLIDCSYSMQNKIDTVNRGLQTLVAEVSAKGLDTRYAVIAFGGTPGTELPELIVQFTSNATFLQRQFGRIKAGNPPGVPGFMGGPHSPQESGFETIRMVLGTANNTVFNHTNVGGDGKIHWRSNATKYIIILTDENSDQPIIPANRFPGQTTRVPPTAWTYTSGGWAQDLNATVQALISQQAHINMFVNSGVAPTNYQYGAVSCDRSGPNFKNFSRSQTLQCLKNNGYGLSLEGQILNLNSNLVARTFNVLEISNTGFIDAFFQYTVSVAASQDNCSKKKRNEQSLPSDAFYTEESGIEKRQQTNASCVIYGCDPVTGCSMTFTCNPGCYQCKIGAVCREYLELRPGNFCQRCLPAKSTTGWSGCDDDNPCTTDSCLSAVLGCYNDYDVCTQACGRCQIGGLCYFANEQNPSDPCQICDPPASFDGWSPDLVSPQCQGATGGSSNTAVATGVSSGSGTPTGSQSASTGNTATSASSIVISASVGPTQGTVSSTDNSGAVSTGTSVGISVAAVVICVVVALIIG